MMMKYPREKGGIQVEARKAFRPIAQPHTAYTVSDISSLCPSRTVALFKETVNPVGLAGKSI
jgi:hypothetical protein